MKISGRLKKHPVCISTDGMISTEMEKVLNAMPAQEKVKAQRVLELNAEHPVFEKLRSLYPVSYTHLPQINEQGRVTLIGARHPLIDKNKVVPTDITLGKDFDSLIITGPNTGGKTVALKTIGLLNLMAMCGLMIPAKEGSEVSV